MNKKGKRLREFEKNNRKFTIRPKRERKIHIVEKEEPADKRAEAREQRKKKKKVVLNVKRFAMTMIIALVIVSVGISGFKMISLHREYNQLAQKQEELLALKESLSSELKYVDSKEYIEQQARKSLKLVKDNEILFILQEKNEAKKEDKDDGKTEN